MSIPPFLRVSLAFLGLAAMSATAQANDAELVPGLFYTASVLAPATQPTVLDLRAATPGTDVAELATWLAQPGPLRIVLLPAATPAAWTSDLAQRAGNAITLGSEAGEVVDFVVTVDAKEAERALTALAEGISPEKLLPPAQKKDRYDEARLVEDHARTGTVPDEMPAPKETSEADTIAKPPVDTLLLRAAHLFAGLRALGRI